MHALLPGDRKAPLVRRSQTRCGSLPPAGRGRCARRVLGQRHRRRRVGRTVRSRRGAYRRTGDGRPGHGRPGPRRAQERTGNHARARVRRAQGRQLVLRTPRRRVDRDAATIAVQGRGEPAAGARLRGPRSAGTDAHSFILSRDAAVQTTVRSGSAARSADERRAGRDEELRADPRHAPGLGTHHDAVGRATHRQRPPRRRPAGDALPERSQLPRVERGRAATRRQPGRPVDV